MSKKSFWLKSETSFEGPAIHVFQNALRLLIHATLPCLLKMILQKFGMTSGSEQNDYNIIEKFVELGGNFFDTANAYENGSSEGVLGNWLKKYVLIIAWLY